MRKRSRKFVRESVHTPSQTGMLVSQLAVARGKKVELTRKYSAAFSYLVEGFAPSREYPVRAVQSTRDLWTRAPQQNA